jgi:hypothetical protein
MEPIRIARNLRITVREQDLGFFLGETGMEAKRMGDDCDLDGLPSGKLT